MCNFTCSAEIQTSSLRLLISRCLSSLTENAPALTADALFVIAKRARQNFPPAKMTEESEKLSARGVPKCELIEDVAGWLAKEKMSPEEAEVVTREKYGKYKYVESSLTAQKARMGEKLPDFDNSLTIIGTLIAKRAANESFETTFLLSDDVYSKATVQKPETVSLWLGANVMVEYGLEEAKQMLEKNRSSVQKVVDELTRELDYLKDQITTTEVNLSHIINYAVAKRRAAAAAAK
ncbi:unnamed protein product [Caenorhabditis sp. 36 PRJEB53466]|nr:unnamed protein product [Caenorhabditis sp. 36 PRJEB53466]